MRDAIKGKKYFDLYIQEEKDDIDWYQSKLLKNEVEQSRILTVRSAVNNARLNIVVAKYSRGDDLDLLGKDFRELLTEYVALGKLGITHTYTENIRLVALAVLFDVSSEQMNELMKLNLHQDSLMEFLLNGEMSIEISEHPLQIEAYQDLYDLIFMDDSRKQAKQLKEFVNNVWYKANDETGWYESHKNSKVNIYNGYWCFEGAAVAKILAIPDDDLKDSPYYPYDLVHMED